MIDMVDIISCFIVLLISACIGLVIVRVVDRRLSDISINMPAITLPKQQITIKMNGIESSISQASIKYESTELPMQTGGGQDIFTNPLEYQPILRSTPTNQPELIPLLNDNDRDPPVVGSYIKHEEKQQRPAAAAATTAAASAHKEGTLLCKSDIASANGKYNSKQYKSEKAELIYSGITPEPSSDHLERPAPYPHVRTTEPAETISYYKDPKDMTATQLIKFKNKARFEHMSVKDYENWLGLHKSMPQHLTGFHRSNLRVLLRGGRLTNADLPRVYPLPPKADHEYTQLMQQGTIDNIPQPEYLGYHPSNDEDQIGAPSKENRSLKHLAFINPDEPLKTWILTHFKPEK
jgi:hypothetical protein